MPQENSWISDNEIQGARLIPRGGKEVLSGFDFPVFYFGGQGSFVDTCMREEGYSMSEFKGQGSFVNTCLRDEGYSMSEFKKPKREDKSAQDLSFVLPRSGGDMEPRSGGDMEPRSGDCTEPTCGAEAQNTESV
ncbi:uncharacterized protein LOC131956793 [Physella acuta]|uniref:uncharacterized protein LOC131956793 n=1 Tax=Physella acuta TaxID=109671 RepID=UPI0027DE5D2D|nr:uncharacterized protein LOC131956793 [Physella acuta]